MEVQLAYDHRTQVTTTFNSSALDFAANTRRLPVVFNGAVKEPYLMRQLMVAVQDVILGDYSWEGQMWVLDPVITVHPDELFFEAFSQDESAYVRLSADMDAFKPRGDTTYGTTNIDFTFALRDAMLDMRSSRETSFTVGRSGFGVATATDDTAPKRHFEQKVDVPDNWVRGFLQVQAALMMKPFTFEVQPAHLLSAINYLLENKARRPPKGLRYQFTPGEPARVILEPWDKAFTFHGAAYDGYERTIRVWGRKRLELLQRVLPYADKVTIGLLGRGLPHFYICHCGAFNFMLALSGWVENDWSQGSSFDLMQQESISDEQIATVYNALTQNLVMKFGELKAHTLLEANLLEAALLHLCKVGRAIYDPVKHRYRSRKLFHEPVDFKTLFAPPPVVQRAQELIDSGQVQVNQVFPSDVRKNEVKVLADVHDETDHSVLVAVDKDMRIRFATCECKFFREHVMSKGPCEHILAARLAADEQLQRFETVQTV